MAAGPWKVREGGWSRQGRLRRGREKAARGALALRCPLQGPHPRPGLECPWAGVWTWALLYPAHIFTLLFEHPRPLLTLVGLPLLGPPTLRDNKGHTTSHLPTVPGSLSGPDHLGTRGRESGIVLCSRTTEMVQVSPGPSPISPCSRSPPQSSWWLPRVAPPGPVNSHYATCVCGLQSVI
jgi:hypothetical protein